MPGTYQYDVEIKSNVAKLLSDMKQVQDRLDTVEGKEYKIKLNVDEKKLSNVISNLEKMLDSLGKGTGNFKQFENLSKELSSIVSEVQSLSKAFGKVDDSGAKTLLSSIQNIDKSLSELSQNFLNVNKNMSNMGGNTSGAVKQVENITNESKKAASALEDVAKAQAKVNGQKTNISSGMKDAFPKTSENLEQVAKSEQKVQQEAVATDKALDNISFTPNTEGFDDIIAKFGILREQAEQITKIVKTTKQTADGTPNISYKATLRNGSSYYLGENSTPQVLNASETVYDAKADNAKKLEREKQIWNELTTSLDRYATLQKRIASNNALSTDNEEATKLLEHIYELQRNDILPAEKLTASNEKLQQINQTVTDLKAKLKETTLDSLQDSIDKYQKIYDQRSTYSSDFTPNEQYTKNLIGLNIAIKNLVEYRNALKNVGEVTVEQEAYLKGLVAACEKASDSFKSLSASEKGTSQIGIDKLVQRINKDLDENTNYSKRAKLGLRALRDELESANPRNLKEITSEIINIENAEIRAGRAGKSFFDIFKTKGMYSFIGQMQSYLSMYIGFYGVMNKIKSTISTVKELDTALVDLKKTTTMNTTQLNEFYYSANDVARQMGVTTEEIINQASAWSRLGYSSNESATKMAKLSSQFASISPGMDIDTATDGLVSTMKAFDVSVDEVQRNIMDNINKIGNTAATSNSEIVDMLTRSSAAMAAANNTLEETIALETAAVEITRSSESTGTAFKTLSMRLRGYDEETESYTGDVEELSGAIADLTKTASTPGGISLFTDDTKQTYKSTYQLLKEISEIWDQLSDKDQAQLLEKLAGKRGGQVVAGLLSNFSAAEKAMKDMGEAAGSSDAEMGIIEQSIEYKLNNLKEIWVGTAQSIAKRDSLGGAIDVLSKLSEGISFVIKNFGLLKTAAIGLIGYLSFKNVGGSKMYDLILF